MQKRDCEALKTICLIGLPLVGWLATLNFFRPAGVGWLQLLPAALKATPTMPMLWVGLVGGGLLAYFAHKWIDAHCDDGFRGEPYRTFLRGTRMVNWHNLRNKVLVENKRYNAQLKSKGHKPRLPVFLGEMPMPMIFENRNLLIDGSIGTGKSVVLETLVGSILRRRDRMIITDPNGHMLSKFFCSGDVILNPYDQRSAGWSIFNEIRSEADFESLAKSVIPPASSAESEEWCSLARNILADTMKKQVEIGKPDVNALVDMLTRADGEVIKTFLTGTDSQGFFRENAERATASVQFLLTKYVRPLRQMTSGEFSLHQWLHNPNARNLFITWREDMKESLKPLVSAWVDIFCSKFLSLNPSLDRRTWLVIDELVSLSKLESFVNAATQGRRYGLCIAAGIQDWAQIDELYGRNGADIIRACFRNYLILGAANAYNAKRSSEIIGRHDVRRLRVTHNNSLSKMADGTHNITHENEPVITESEISNLPDLTGYIIFPGELPIARMQFKPPSYPVRCEPFKVSR